MKSTRKGPRRNKATPLAGHRKVGKTLRPPLAQLPVKTLNWIPDMLPEMIWIGTVLQDNELATAVNLLHSTLDALEVFLPTESQQILTGLISSFALIQEDRRSQAVQILRNNGVYDLVLPDEMKHALALYPSCPMLWLLDGWEERHHVDFEVGVRYFKNAVLNLTDSHGTYANRCRMVVLARMMKHKIALPDHPSIEMLGRYSDDMAEDEQRSAESVARAIFAAYYGSDDLEIREWTPYFWRHNYQISPCELPDEAEASAREWTRDELGPLVSATKKLMLACEQATLSLPLDLYDLHKDEVLFGLTSRQFRLFSAVASNPELCAADLGFMIHRAMADTQIVISWLAHKNDASLYDRFKRYSVGKQKLFKLHLEEISDHIGLDSEELEAGLTDRINEEFWEELLPIDLGAVFEGTSTRKMAKDVGLDNLYHMVFSPASAEVHGDWASLKEYYLRHCINPLHRFHRLPQFDVDHHLSPGIVLTASSILADTVHVWLSVYHLETNYNAAVNAFRGAVAHFFHKTGTSSG